MKLLQELRTILPPSERRAGGILLCWVAVAAILEGLAVASILPFFKLLLAPLPLVVPHELRPIVFPLFTLVGTRPRVALGVVVLVLVLASNLTSFMVARQQMRFVHHVGDTVARQLLATFVATPYERLAQIDVARLTKQVLHESDEIVQGIIKPVVYIVASASTLVSMLVVIAAVFPPQSLAVLAMLAAAYGLVFMFLRRGVHRAGVERGEANRLRFKLAGDIFGGIKEIRAALVAPSFLGRFADASGRYSSVTARQQLLQMTPRYVVDTFAVATMVATTLILVSADRSVPQLLPSLAVMAFAGYRAQPHFQNVVANVMQFAFHRAMLTAVAKELDERVEENPKPSAAVRFEHVARLENVTVHYPERVRPAVSDLSIEVAKGSRVALVGKTGAGKSTVADAFLGLVRPTSGSLVIDGIPITSDNRGAWQSMIGYVPQRIYLGDDSIRNNVVFGSAEGFDIGRFERAVSLAHLDEFARHLPEGYNTLVGERGVRLSGGQQQRIGIARALYRDPAILVLDEATSDLDATTQAAIVASLEREAPTLTILMIAHRTEVVENCDRVYVMDRGRVVAEGTYTEIRDRMAESPGVPARG